MFLIGFYLAWEALAGGVLQRQPDCQVFSVPIQIQVCPGSKSDYGSPADRDLCDDHGSWDKSAKRTSLEDMLECGVDFNRNHFHITDDDRMYQGRYPGMSTRGYNRTDLMIAAEEGWTDIVSQLISKQVDINRRDNFGMTALMLAAGNGHLPVVRILVNNGADMSTTDEMREHAMMKAARGGHIEVVKYFLDNGADVDRKVGFQGDTILVEAAKRGHLDMVSMLIKRGAEVNVYDRKRTAPLIEAASNGYATIVSMLLENGADGVNMKKYGYTPLMYLTNYPRIIAALLKAGAEVNMQNTKVNGFTALMFAVVQGNSETVSILMDNGADANIADTEIGQTALMLAAVNGYFEIVSTLIDNGADVNIVSMEGMTALQYATRDGHDKIVALLKKY